MYKCYCDGTDDTCTCVCPGCRMGSHNFTPPCAICGKFECNNTCVPVNWLGSEGREDTQLRAQVDTLKTLVQFWNGSDERLLDAVRYLVERW